ncbi:MAG TPA: substrate-binding domain-containing protein [Longimicrobiales bacterium]|nr:substrate-binding domain-containing protein [Longimicrobiales bacterium]
MLPVLAALLVFACAGDGRELILASTTSTQDSGLFEALLPAFMASHPDVRVKVIAVGTGEALALGRRRDADALLVHSPADELAFMESGHGLRRLAIMHNDFVVVGPAADPAGVGGMTDAAAALRRIAERAAAFISRGDSSGTHRKELALWHAAGVHGAHVDVGQGMGETLAVASERGAYTLTDRATYLALRDGLQLDILVAGDPALLNHYSVITVAGARNGADADTFATWLTSAGARALIGDFGRARYGQPLFFPAR